MGSEPRAIFVCEHFAANISFFAHISCTSPLSLSVRHPRRAGRIRLHPLPIRPKLPHQPRRHQRPPHLRGRQQRLLPRRGMRHGRILHHRQLRRRILHRVRLHLQFTFQHQFYLQKQLQELLRDLQLTKRSVRRILHGRGAHFFGQGVHRPGFSPLHLQRSHRQGVLQQSLGHPILRVSHHQQL